MKITKWKYTTDELIRFILQYNFRDYTIFIESSLCERSDHHFVCGSWLIESRDYKELIKFISIYPDEEFLLTGINVDDKRIIFNFIKREI